MTKYQILILSFLHYPWLITTSSHRKKLNMEMVLAELVSKVNTCEYLLQSITRKSRRAPSVEKWVCFM